MSRAVDTLLDVGFARRWVRNFAESIERDCGFLTRLDAAIGDADHGINMRRGMRAALAVIDDTAPPAVLFDRVGKALMLNVGGAAGPLYGTAFRRFAGEVGHIEVLTGDDLAAGLAAAISGIQQIGAAEEGDKTMVDAFAPAVRALVGRLAVGASLEEAVSWAARAAEEGMVATIPLRALKGRASYLGARSEGHQDPGATSTALLFRALADALRI